MERKYYIDYDISSGRILGFLIGENLEIKKGKIIEVSLDIWEEGISFNKINIKDKKISFENVSWETEEEIETFRISNINNYTQSYIFSKYPIEKQSSANLGIYNNEYKAKMVAFIKNIIDLSNKAISENLTFEQFKSSLEE